MFYENLVAQMLNCQGNDLYFYTHYSPKMPKNDIEIDFLLSNRSKTNLKIYPLEVKSSKNYTTKSLNKFNAKFKERVEKSYIVRPKQYSIDGDIIKLPPYFVPFLFSE